MLRSDGLDWLKAVGISLIVYGHVAASTTVTWTPPIYVKQIGVALFVFASGFTLARDRRSVADVLLTRLFPIYVFGLAVAGTITVTGFFFGAGLASGSGLALSNYLPFLGGANVVFDNFPANPTTWYVGTYLHILLVWALWLRHRRVDLRFVVGAFLLEIPIRAALIVWAGPFVAYMLITNWIAVFLLGIVFGRRSGAVMPSGALPYIAALTVVLPAWSVGARFVTLEPTFPFMTLHGWPEPVSVLMVSTAVSVLYLATTILAAGAAWRMTAPAPVKFLARNSLLIFLAHMPLYFTFHPVLVSLRLTYLWRTAILLIVCLFLLAIGSELVTRLIRPKQLGDAVKHLLIGTTWNNPRAEAIGGACPVNLPSSASSCGVAPTEGLDPPVRRVHLLRPESEGPWS